ncbi:riboflavin kinase / FMN adenylyltransferase [Thermoflavimicrobium dichotomicum]|uniref:Riboflavin biosynthesis protein n=2 Tax=Thermoflavimicrobium dichotomicum TaxID=46223 RepID=A0A1I3PR33_9BACL|nr:riboflavin kinase / FMN adenylyltransferase [Thermoflavimicrobium dichotomicum]
MKVTHLSYPLQQQNGQPISLAIGFFDGVHRGHQAVIKRAKDLARELGATPAVMTFHPHPREILGQANITRYLTPLSEKLEQFAKLGVQKAYVMQFDLTFAALSKESFVQEVLLPLQVKGVATGFNFTFGRNASGKAEDLARLGKGHFRAEIVHAIQSEGIVISSTRLRQALSDGDVGIAREILGRNYQLEGIVVHGDKRGRLLGFPTANIELEQPFFTPRRGVYIVKAMFDQETAMGIMNIGVRPTFHDPTPRERLEVHLLDRQVDLYGKKMKVEFLHFLREEKKFASMEALSEQIMKDQQAAYEWLAK